jgi:hypothetical protein
VRLPAVDDCVDEEDEVLTRAELVAGYAARAAAQRNSGAYNAITDEYDPRQSSLHESVVHAMSLRAELTGDEYAGSSQFKPAHDEKEYLDDLSFLSSSSLRKSHLPSSTISTTQEYVPTCSQGSLPVNEYVPSLTNGSAAPPISAAKPSQSQRSFAPESKYSDDDDCWGDFDIPKDERYRESSKASTKELSFVPEEADSGVCMCEDCTAVYSTKPVRDDFGVGLPPAA